MTELERLERELEAVTQELNEKWAELEILKAMLRIDRRRITEVTERRRQCPMN